MCDLLKGTYLIVLPHKSNTNIHSKASTVKTIICKDRVTHTQHHHQKKKKITHRHTQNHRQKKKRRSNNNSQNLFLLGRVSYMEQSCIKKID